MSQNLAHQLHFWPVLRLMSHILDHQLQVVVHFLDRYPHFRTFIARDLRNKSEGDDIPKRILARFCTSERR